jgi:orotate phosphoribosyltransferase-like protein
MRAAWETGKDCPVIVARSYDSRDGSIKAKFNDCSYGIKNHPDYRPAKFKGDVRAAHRLVKKALTATYLGSINKLIENLKQSGNRDQEPVLVAPVKKGSKNMLAKAHASVLGKELSLEVNSSIQEKDGVSRKEHSGLDRLFALPEFTGKVEPGRTYIGVDDMYSSGGTMASLRSYITQNGGKFAGVLSLASIDGKDSRLNVTSEEISKLNRIYGEGIRNLFSKKAGFGFDRLTREEYTIVSSRQSAAELSKSLGSQQIHHRPPSLQASVRLP